MSKALVTSCDNNNIQLAKLLLEKRADVHYKNELCLEEATLSGNFDLLKLVISNGANVNSLTKDSVEIIMEKCSGSILEYLFQHGLVLTDEMIYYTVKSDNLEGFKIVMDKISNISHNQI